uniref:site-specific DNA-methyltransferase n=1 Tax=uncultured Vibrio sp. TaxID=114054 RepID=UPI00262D4B0D
PVPYYKGKHPCEKPADMLEHIITTSSLEGAVVLDAFMGSGSTGHACLKLNRKFIGIEMEEDRFEMTVEALSDND